MRVLHVIPSISERAGGPSQAILPMCRALTARGMKVLLATTDDGIATSNLQHERIVERDGVDAVFFPVQAGKSFKYSRPFAAWLNANVEQFDVVHIHAVFNHSCIAAANACRRHGVPYIVRPLGTLDPWSMSQKPLRKKVFWYAGIRRILSEAAAVHYTTKAEQEAVERSLGLNHGRVVPLGINTNGSTNSIPAHRSTRDRYVLVLSRLHPKKGLDVLIRAFLALVARDEFKDVRLVLAGDGDESYVSLLKQEARNHPSITFAGWLAGDQKVAALRNAALLALPSYQENFGVCVLEALAVGVPVVLSPQVNLAQQIESVGAGWITETHEGKLEETLAEALRDDVERSRRAGAGAIWAKQFSWPAVAAQLTHLYDEINSKANIG